MTHTFDFNDDLTLDTGEFMAFDDIENDIYDDDMNFLHDDDFMQFEEGDLFFKKLWRGVKKVARAAAPIATQLAPTIGKIVGGAVGSFAGAPTIGATVGTHLGNFVQNLEDEGDGSFAGLEADTDTHDEMEAEDFIKPSEDDEGLAEYMASAAATAKTAVDSAAMAGGIATAATAKSPSNVQIIGDPEMTQNPPRSTSEIDEIMTKLAAYRSWLVSSKRSEIIARPKYAEALNQQITDLEALVETAECDIERDPDGGLLGMIGLGQNPLENIGDTPYMPSIPEYDDQVNRERISAIADLYYIYQHERLGVFRAVLKLQDLFRSGSVRLSDGAGAVKLYQYDRKQILRYTQRDRRAAYRKVFGYTDTAPPDGAEPNAMFHPLFTKFTQQVSQFFQDKRVSEVIRPDGRTGTYGSQAVVRRSGLDLRHNLKQVSYGHIAILKTEVMGLLNAAFEILDSPDIRHLFGSNSAWDTLEEVMKRHLSETPIISQRRRMAVAGRDILRWLGEDFLVTNVRTDLETYLEDIVDSADDWLTSAESLGLQRQSGMTGSGNVVPLTTRKLKSG